MVVSHIAAFALQGWMMRRRGQVLVVLLGAWAIVLALAPEAARASQTVAAVKAVTNRLVRSQWQGGPLKGAWRGEEEYTGSIVAGLVSAYTMTCDDDAKAAAVAGGNYILRTAAGNYYGDEAYALMCLSQISQDPSLNAWRFALEDFYQKVAGRPQDGTRGYIAQFERTDPSVAVFCMAHHTVAAFHVDADDKEIWRDALVDYLIRVDDESAASAVMSLGTAMWALAATGRWDDSLLDPDGKGAFYWQGYTFDELPELLLSHRITEGELAGSFYWRFDHGTIIGGPPGGYTEESVSSALGLAAGGLVADGPEIKEANGLLRALLVGSIGADGYVRQHLTLGGRAYHSEMGRLLQALAALTNPADLDLDGCVDGADLAILSAHWLRAGRDCISLGDSDRVDVRDLMVLADNWLDHARHNEAVPF